MSYVCENAVANPKTCDFRSGKVILQQEIAREQMAKLLGEGRTDLLTGFKSSRTGRNFKAYLVKQSDGKIGFEFEKKEPSAKTAAKTSSRSAVASKGSDETDGAAEKAAAAAPAKKAASKTAGKTTGKTTAKAAAKTPAKRATARKVSA
jgi:DNA topoisomerase-3